MTERYVIFTSEINAATANNFINFLIAQIAAGTTKLIMSMNCLGGQVNAGIAIYSSMLAMPYEIVTHNISNVDSIANVIFLGAANRRCSPGATFMFHSVGFNATAGQRLEEKNLRELLDSVTADHKRISSIIAARTKITIEEGMKLFVEQRALGAQWAHDNGVISSIEDFKIPAGSNVQLVSQ